MIWLTTAACAALACGILLVVAWSRARRPTLAMRLEPYVRSTPAEELRRRSATVTPFPALERIVGPVARDAAALVQRWAGNKADVALRLRRAGGRLTPEQFRSEQLMWALCGLVAGLVVSGLLLVWRGSSLLSLVALVAVAGASGGLARGFVLSVAIRRRERRMVAELPAVAELLALAVTAGESAPGALERVVRSTSGELTRELEGALAHTRSGTRLSVALTAMADESSVPALQRFATGIATAVDRGTPLADVLRAQAADARAQGRQLLVEEGGKREIAMLVPVVFLVLPVTVLFAVFPGAVALRWGG